MRTAASLALLIAVAAPVAPARAACEAMEMAVVNQGAAPVTAALRQAASDAAWEVAEVAPGERAVVALCLEMVLSVASAEYRAQDGGGGEICSGSAFVPAGAEAVLVVGADGTCGLKSNR